MRLVVLALALVAGLAGCKTSSEEALHDVLDSLAQDPNAWLERLEAARQSLEDDEEEALAMEVGLAVRAVRATISGASPCSNQHAENRVRRLVEDVVDAMRHGDGTILPVEPLICEMTPPRLSVETEPAIWQKGKISGYDFDRLDLSGEQMQLYWFTTSDEGEDLQHIPWLPNAPGVFDATIDLWSVNEELTTSNAYRHLELWWGGQRLRTVHLSPSNHDGVVPVPSDARMFSFLPKEQIGDDANFDGACQIDANATLKIHPSDGSKLVLQLDMHALEVGKGSTEVSGTSDLDDDAFVVFQAESGYKIDEILAPHSADCAKFKDEDHDVDYPRDPEACGLGLVRRWRIVGDTDGAEAGDRTRVSAQLERIEVSVVEK